jgi:hypothetical protein
MTGTAETWTVWLPLAIGGSDYVANQQPCERRLRGGGQFRNAYTYTDYEDKCFRAYGHVQSGRNLLMFRRKAMPPSSESPYKPSSKKQIAFMYQAICVYYR